jgi:hypothetical protein
MTTFINALLKLVNGVAGARQDASRAGRERGWSLIITPVINPWEWLHIATAQHTACLKLLDKILRSELTLTLNHSLLCKCRNSQPKLAIGQCSSLLTLLLMCIIIAWSEL